MSIEDIARRFRRTEEDSDQPADYEVIRSAREERRQHALTALRGDKDIQLREPKSQPSDHERRRNLPLLLAGGIGAGAVAAAAIGVAVVIHRHEHESELGSETDDEADA